MHLKNFTIRGFRSLTQVAEIPVSGPTILAGHNDGGKSAVLAALMFLVGKYKLVEDDRTYDAQGPNEGQAQQARLQRCERTEVEGEFTLDGWEQRTFDVDESLRLRRSAGEDLISTWEIWGSIPDDERLIDLSQWNAKELKELATEFQLTPASIKKPDVEAALRTYGRAHASTKGWLPAPTGISKRLPRVLPFDGKAADPDDEVKAALSGRFQSHIADPALQGQLKALEEDVKALLVADAKSLCDHIRLRCPDLQEVFVAPEVAFTGGLRGAPLRIARTGGESVSLERSGLGSNRRVSLAVWEWTSELLDEDNAATPGEDELPDEAAPPLQTIVIYDEPDTHLDYGHQRKIMNLIRKQSAIENVRVIVATHSMNLIDGVDISDVVHLKLIEGRTAVERLGLDSHGEIDKHLQAIAASVGLRNSVLLQERCFLAVEGETEQRAFPLLFRLSEGMSLQSAGIALWACFNNDGALHFAGYLAKHDRAVMLVVDADSRNLPKSVFKTHRLTEFFGDRHDDVVNFLGEGDGFNELEELFDDNLWASVANRIWQRSTGSWTAGDFTAHRGGKFSVGVQEMLQAQSPTGPGGKPDMMYELAEVLTRPEDVPAQLRAIFKDLRALAL